MSAVRIYVLLLLLAMAVAACISSFFVRSRQELRASALTWSIPRQEMSFFPLTIIDGRSRLPVVGADVHPVCLGGTPYVHDHYTTDRYGVVRVVYFARSSIVPVRIQADGYPIVTHAARASDLTVHLAGRTVVESTKTVEPTGTSTAHD